LVEVDKRICLNVPLLMYLSKIYGGIPVNSCDLVDFGHDVGIFVGGGLGSHLSPFFH
jgi:hypothetical protein